MQRKIEDLTIEECMTLLGRESVGRLAFVDPEGPVAVPVNFGLAGEQILFRLEPDSHLRAAVEHPVAFEVDHTDPDTGSGWSVLVRGDAAEVELDDVPRLLRLMAGRRGPGPKESTTCGWRSPLARSPVGGSPPAPSGTSSEWATRST